jgi:hypothetical protein
MHDHFACSGADDGADQIAEGERHLPPSFLPGANAAQSPCFSELLQRPGRPARHGSERVADQIGSMFEDGKLLTPRE